MNCYLNQIIQINTPFKLHDVNGAPRKDSSKVRKVAYCEEMFEKQIPNCVKTCHSWLSEELTPSVPPCKDSWLREQGESWPAGKGSTNAWDSPPEKAEVRGDGLAPPLGCNSPGAWNVGRRWQEGPHLDYSDCLQVREGPWWASLASGSHPSGDVYKDRVKAGSPSEAAGAQVRRSLAGKEPPREGETIGEGEFRQEWHFCSLIFVANNEWWALITKNGVTCI